MRGGIVVVVIVEALGGATVQQVCLTIVITHKPDPVRKTIA